MTGQVQHKANIVDAAQAVIELLLSAYQVVHIGRIIILTGIAIAALFNGTLHHAKTRGLDIDAPV